MGASEGSLDVKRAGRLLAPVAIAVAVVALPAIAWAKFSGTASVSLRASTHVLAAPSSVTALGCTGNAKNDRYVTVGWAPSADAYVSGYVVTLTGSDGTNVAVQVTGRGTAGTTVDAAHKTSYTVTVAATYANWTSAPTAAPEPANC